MIVARHAERSRLNRLVADAQDGRGGSLTVRGEAGIGKTALFDYAAGIADGMRVCRVVGSEAEAELPYAALQLCLGRYADRLDALPEPQAQALRAAFGAAAPAGDRHLVGAATLTLLSQLAAEQPLLCLFDDVQWFDQSSVDALVFAVRRSATDAIATVFGVRDGVRAFTAPGDDIALPRLGSADAAQLLATVRPVPQEIADRIVADSGGNPLAIVEFAGEASRAASPLPVAPLPAVGRLEEHFRRQIRALPGQCRRSLALAAAHHGARLGTFVDAAAKLGLHAADLEPAERARLVTVTPDALDFRHPLIRAAAYQEATFAERVQVHRALADASSDPCDADRRAWHLAAATDGPDDTAAAELERAATRARDRGAPAAAARALERAAQLSGSGEQRGGLLVSAARAAYDAGQLDRAAELATAGGALTVRAGEAAEAGLVRAQVAYERDSPASAAAHSLAAAEPILATDPDRAVGVLTEATWCARDAADADLLDRCAAQLRSIQDGPADVVRALLGPTYLLRGDVGAAVGPIRSLVDRSERPADPALDPPHAGFLSLLVGDDDVALSVLDDQVAALRGQGAIGWLPYALEPLALANLAAGKFRDADSNVTEGVALAAELGQDMQVVVLTAIRAWLAAVRGDGDAGREHAGVVLGDSRRHGMAAAQANWALGLLDLAGGMPETALDRLDRACAGLPGRDFTIRAIPDHVEATVRAGHPDQARRHLPRLAAWAADTKSQVATALALRCEALLEPGPEAQERFEAALAIADSSPYDRARTQLAYAEWLRRHRRQAAARTQLSEAHAAFERISAHVWLPRVRTELVALGGNVPEPTTVAGSVGGVGRLTPQELQVVRLAALGLTNPEIAARLFLSPRTVGHHLYKAYPKLGVARRAQLAQLDL